MEPTEIKTELDIAEYERYGRQLIMKDIGHEG
jgi:hypothetical protein